MDKELNYNWYLIGTRGGKEKKIIEEIKLELKKSEYKDLVSDLRSFNSKGKYLKSYILCHCHLTEELMRFFHKIPNVVGFIRNREGEMPVHVSQEIVKNFFNEMEKKEEKSTSDEMENGGVKIGDLVKINEGTFIDHEGRISHIDKKRGKTKIILEKLG